MENSHGIDIYKYVINLA
uniref:Uncharacterized protein n=1 Tax=Rhizophora mucronata TaxID=61149 RepID=A0A2P2Q2M2_RHIMU